MDIKQTIVNDTDDDVTCAVRIEIDGKRRFSVMAGEPEDATFGRDLNDCLFVLDLIREAHAAGTRGDPLNVTEETQER
jgi:hypothetical protein